MIVTIPIKVNRSNLLFQISLSLFKRLARQNEKSCTTNTPFLQSFLNCFARNAKTFEYSERLSRIRSPLWDKKSVGSLEICQLPHGEPATEKVMAQGNPRLDLNPEEDISDVVHDLDLLFPDRDARVTSIDMGRELRDKKKKELMKTNGTLQEVV